MIRGRRWGSWKSWLEALEKCAGRLYGQCAEDRAEVCEARAGCAGFAGQTERFEEETVEFEFLAALKINEGGGFVGAHRFCAVDVDVRGGFGHGKPAGLRGMDDFKHQFADELEPARIGKEEIGGKTRAAFLGWGELAGNHGLDSRATCNTKSVERNVPNQFFPVGLFEVFGDFARHAGGGDKGCDGMRSRQGRAAIFAENNHSVIDVVNLPRRGAVDADETEAAHCVCVSGNGGDGGFVAEAVLQSEHDCAGANQRTEERGQRGVGGGFEGDDYQLHGADFFGSPGAPRLDVEVAVNAFDLNAEAADNFVIGAEKEVNFVAGLAESRAIIASQGTAADDGDFHLN